MKLIVIDHPKNPPKEHINSVANAPLSAALNVPYALGTAQKAGWEWGYKDYRNSGKAPEEIAEEVKKEAPDLVLIHWVYHWRCGKDVKRLIALLTQSKLPTGAFGLFPTLMAGELMERSSIDFILVGEFELTLERLLRMFSREINFRLPGVMSREQSYLPSDSTPDPGDLPFPVDPPEHRETPFLNITASRGCYGRCSFCFIPRYYQSSCWRMRKAEGVVKELELRGKNKKYAYFTDPNFLGGGKKDHARILTIAEGLKERNLTFGFEARVNDVTAPLIRRLKDLGMGQCFLGVESAIPSVLKGMNKMITPGQSIRALRALRENGIEPSVGFIMFDPLTTIDELKENYRFLESNGLLTDPFNTANLLSHDQIVLKGTGAFESLKERGLLKVKNFYEGTVVYKEEKIKRIALSMNRITAEYLSALKKKTLRNENEINMRMKEGFQDMLNYAEDPGSISRIEAEVMEVIRLSVQEKISSKG